MSQHTFRTIRNGEPVEVLLGWDRPLSRYFMVVETEAQAASDKDAYLYDNMSDPASLRGETGLDHYRAKLTELGIEVPESLFIEVQIDANLNTGNRVVQHDADGTLHPRS